MKIFKALSLAAAIAACLGAANVAVASDTVETIGAAKSSLEVQIAKEDPTAKSASNLFLSENGRNVVGAASNAAKAEDIVNVSVVASDGVQTGQSAPAHKATVDHSVAIQTLDTTDQSACGLAAAENSWQSAYFSNPALTQARDYVQSDQQAATNGTVTGFDGYSMQELDHTGAARYLSATAWQGLDLTDTSKQAATWPA